MNDNQYEGRHRDNSEQADIKSFVSDAMARLPKHSCGVHGCGYVGRHRPERAA